MKGTVLVTGAEGFIGRAVRRRLAGQYRLLSVDIRPLTAVERLEPPSQPLGERCFQVDLGDIQAIDRFWLEVRDVLSDLAAVIHLAAFYNFDNQPDARYDRLLAGLEHLLPRIAAEAPPDSPFIFASSMAAMAPTEPGYPLTPESPTLGGWAYPVSKLRAEEIMSRVRIPQPVVQLVLAGVYSDACELVPLFRGIELVYSRSIQKYLYPGPKDRGLTYVHVEETADAFARAIERLRGQGGIHRLLIGQERPLTYTELHARASLAFHGRKAPIIRVPKWLTWIGAWVIERFARLLGRRTWIKPWMIRFAGEHFEFDISRTREVLGWSPWRSVHRDLDGMLRLARDDHQTWLRVNLARPW